ncbi:hypothetical protein A3D88_03935 [Candidatus Peribacteria bacterium RIFCSPHIGHO2_02_FULL_52_16]|nr:MAG: hypothetical protein A2706_05215 [Candidatus Peribacteria bacterium RIFCSPHIGHO2_01_FULL_51_35]OGJ61869.1 MAG: hypothetical protein A3D88_03935 [Candidatus Peribacteria bacterium RIFCSPHIGHO2_02_FULL_52_16]
MTTKVDEIFAEMTAPERSEEFTSRFVTINFWDATARYVNEIRDRMAKGKGGPGFKRDADYHESQYRLHTSIELLPDGERQELITRLTDEFRRRHTEWAESPEGKSHAEMIADFVN